MKTAKRIKRSDRRMVPMNPKRHAAIKAAADAKGQTITRFVADLVDREVVTRTAAQG